MSWFKEAKLGLFMHGGTEAERPISSIAFRKQRPLNDKFL